MQTFLLMVAFIFASVGVWFIISAVVMLVTNNPNLWDWRGNSLWLATLVPLFALVAVAFLVGRSFG